MYRQEAQTKLEQHAVADREEQKATAKAATDDFSGTANGTCEDSSDVGRKRTPYEFFRSEQRAAMRQQHPNVSGAEMAKLLADKWKALSKTDRLVSGSSSEFG